MNEPTINLEAVEIQPLHSPLYRQKTIVAKKALCEHTKAAYRPSQQLMLIPTLIQTPILLSFFHRRHFINPNGIAELNACRLNEEEEEVNR
ncbi:hypothetical protein L1887_11913 [Cichorium endivia]|nr:hypothetical protein L1887_11913 [Cichorium endivia]